ncbi:MAG: FTR1 family protein [Terrimicrobiaceae bacterium]
MPRPFHRVGLLLMAATLSCGAGWAGLTEDFHQVQQHLGEALLDAYAGDSSSGDLMLSSQGLARLAPYLKGQESQRLIETASDGGASISAKIGCQRALLQHIAALEMLHSQRAGDVPAARQWRALISLPKFVSEQDSTLLLQTADPSQAATPEISETLAREYLLWQTMRVRQLLDFLQHQVERGTATQAVVEAYTAETAALASFPPDLLKSAKLLPQNSAPVTTPHWKESDESKVRASAIAQWREDLEATLPNLLSDTDISRMQRLLARLLKLIPREYENGVSDGKITIEFEYREAVMFTEKAQGLVNQLAPVWKLENAENYRRAHDEITELLTKLSADIPNLLPQKEIQNLVSQITSILEKEFQISARRAGDKGNIIEETALEVRVSLGSSLAAVEAGQWEMAEALRLDAYTAFDFEIEPRVLPRNPDLGRRAERSFLDGEEGSPGIKLALDRRAPMEEIRAAYERTLGLLDQSMEMLKVAVSPGTIAATAFGIVAREGLEAVVILAALLAGLRGPEQSQTRKGIAIGAWLALLATVVTFWLSRTIITSLVQYGERLEAVVSILAVGVLLIVTNWVFHKYYWTGWNAKLRSLSKSAANVRSPRWEWLALLSVGFLTIYREGFETALFLQSLLLEGNIQAVVMGGAAALFCIGSIGVLTFRYGVKLPYRKLLIVTGFLVVTIMVTFVGSTVRLFQTVGWLSIHPIPHLNLPHWIGLWFGLYPSWEGILIPLASLAYVGGAWLFLRWRSGQNPRGEFTPSRPPAQQRASV